MTSFKAHLLRRHQVYKPLFKFPNGSDCLTKVEGDACAFLPFLSPEEKFLLEELVRYKVVEIMRRLNILTFENIQVKPRVEVFLNTGNVEFGAGKIFTERWQETKAEVDDGEPISHVYDVEDDENEDLKQIQNMLLAEEIELSDDDETDVEVKEIPDGEDVKQGGLFEENDAVVEVKLEEKEEKGENIPEFCCLCYNTFEDSDIEQHNTEAHAEDQEALTMVFSEENLCFNCNFCPLRFLTENLLSTHIRTKHMATFTMVDCKECGKSLRSKQLSKHMQTHQEKKFECKLCYKKFSIQKYLEDHQKNVHRSEQHLFEQDLTEDDLLFECTNEQCDKRFASELILEYHKKHGHKEAFLYCTFCPQVFPSTKMLQKHCKDVHGRKMGHTRKENICKLCYNSFEKNSNLNSHKKIHKEDKDFFNREINESDLQFMCTDINCGQKFVSEKILKYHINRKHTTFREIEFKHLKKGTKKGVIHDCPLCYVQFKSFYTMHNHILDIHHEDKDLLKEGQIEEKPIYNCSQCDHTFQRPSILEYHTNRMHQKAGGSKIKSVKINCRHCAETFKHIKAAKAHSLEIHKTPYIILERTRMQYKCSLCYQLFRRNRYLQNHIQSMHQNELFYLDQAMSQEDLTLKCSQCEKKFVSENSLAIHVQRTHGQTDVYCKLCYLKFKRPSELKKHKKVLHKLELSGFDTKLDKSQFEHSCEICDKKFWTKNILTHHLRYRHKEKPRGTKGETWCQLCSMTFDRPAALERHKAFLHKSEMHGFDLHLDESLLVHSCKDCDKRFWTENILEYHRRYKHKTLNPKEDQECELCGKLFKWTKDQKSKLKKHMYNIHTAKDNPVKEDKKIDRYCKLCYISFDRPSVLEKHKATLHRYEMTGFDIKLEESQLVHPCKLCDKKFWTKNILEYHRRYKHKGEDMKEDKECQFCGKLFKWDKNRNKRLSNHIASVHKTTANRGQLDNNALDNFQMMMKILGSKK